MIYYTYKITLTSGHLTNHYYLGMHKTENINDNYKGSGKILINYYKKYPNDYIKEIISYYDDFESLCKAEKELIGDLYKSDPLCINIKPGGNGGSYKGINKGRIRSEETRQKISKKNTGKTAWNKGISLSEDRKIKQSNIMKGKQSPRKGCKLTEEEKNNIKIATIEAMKDPKIREACRKGGLKTSGLKWMHKDNNIIRVKPNEVEKYLNNGFSLGMKPNNKIHITKKRYSPIGTIWVNNGEIQKHIKPENFDEYEAKGFIKGRQYRKYRN